MNSAVISEASAFEKRRFLVFRIARRVYALSADAVVEVIRVPPTARVPQAPKALIGVANLRGVVLPIASLHALLGLEIEEGADSRAIVLAGVPVAIVVDAIDALVAIGQELVQTQAAQLNVELGRAADWRLPARQWSGRRQDLGRASASHRSVCPSHPPDPFEYGNWRDRD